MGRRKAGAGGGHAAVLSAGAGWEARRAAGLGVRPETAAEATGRPPGKSLGAFCGLSIHWWLPNLGGLERAPAFNGGVAGWDYPFTEGSQITQERRAARRTMAARGAGSRYSLCAPNAVWFTGAWGDNRKILVEHIKS